MANAKTHCHSAGTFAIAQTVHSQGGVARMGCNLSPIRLHVSRLSHLIVSRTAPGQHMEWSRRSQRPPEPIKNGCGIINRAAKWLGGRMASPS
ncbi:unnamed protein product [Caenorhabditis auriculariae]|uniref:Uncharacterized protein n=1 Tax=Caenorhabditis auriculariae TaxID=2777116 RepID=A0A8S1HZH1_9PELO|nr:unnamed protein product [Caenorhabditis auriculariae]